jgi:hypothetical protein
LVQSPRSLQLLADIGVAQLPPDRLESVAEESWAWGVATGDARYCVLWRTIQMVDAWFGEGDDRRLASSFIERIDVVVKRELPGVLAAADAETGTNLAAALDEALVCEHQLAGDPLRPHYGPFNT